MIEIAAAYLAIGAFIWFRTVREGDGFIHLAVSLTIGPILFFGGGIWRWIRR